MCKLAKGTWPCVVLGLMDGDGLTFGNDERLRVGQIVLVDPPSKDAEGERVKCSAFLCIISFFSPSAVMDEQSKF